MNDKDPVKKILLICDGKRSFNILIDDQLSSRCIHVDVILAPFFLKTFFHLVIGSSSPVEG